MKIALVLALILVGLMLAGCGADSYREGPKVGGSYYEVKIPWPPGSPIGTLYCLRMGGPSHTSGITCDWVRWHRETRQ